MLINIMLAVLIPLCLAVMVILDLWSLIKPHVRPELIKRLLLACIVLLAVLLALQKITSK